MLLYIQIKRLTEHDTLIYKIKLASPFHSKGRGEQKPNNMKNEHKIGCDNCGKAKPVFNSKKKLPLSKQWIQLFLCKECQKIKI